MSQYIEHLMQETRRGPQQRLDLSNCGGVNIAENIEFWGTSASITLDSPATIIGEGAYGIVYLGYGSETAGRYQSMVAIKETRGPGEDQRFIREVAIQVTLFYGPYDILRQCVPSIYAAYICDGMTRGLLVMQKWTGSISSLLKNRSSPVPSKDRVYELFRGINAMHLMGVMHRDLHVGNIVYDLNEDVISRLGFIDFGLAYDYSRQITAVSRSITSVRDRVKRINAADVRPWDRILTRIVPLLNQKYGWNLSTTSPADDLYRKMPEFDDFMGPSEAASRWGYDPVEFIADLLNRTDEEQMRPVLPQTIIEIPRSLPVSISRRSRASRTANTASRRVEGGRQLSPSAERMLQYEMLQSMNRIDSRRHQALTEEYNLRSSRFQDSGQPIPEYLRRIRTELERAQKALAERQSARDAVDKAEALFLDHDEQGGN